MHDPENSFEVLWQTFYRRYPFFALRGVNWNTQYEIYRPRVSKDSSDDELFDIFCEMLAPLNDGHVELIANSKGIGRKVRSFNPEPKPKFYQEFSKKQIRKLFKVTGQTLSAYGFGKIENTKARILRFSRSDAFGYLRILELEGVKKRKLAAALNWVSAQLGERQGLIVDIRDNPGGDDDIVLKIVNRFCDRRRVAFHRRTKTGPGENEYKPRKTWHMKPEGDVQFTGPIVLLTCDAVFSGAEVFALAMRALPHVTILGDHTNGIFSYQLEKELPNGWDYCLSYQKYYSQDMVCYEGTGVPPDIKLLNSKADLRDDVDPLIERALEVLKQGTSGAASPA